jgi:imidazolonepropionase-like amidohydrolase
MYRCATVVAADTAAAVEPGATVLVGDWVLRPDGSLGKDLGVVIRDGKVRRLVKADEAGSTTHHLPPGAVVCPGMLDLFSYAGAVGQTVEISQLIDPDASPLNVLDPGHPDFRSALTSGITAVMVSPTPANLVNGVGVCVRTYIADGQLDVLRDNGPLILAFGEGVWRSDRAPTSRAGTIRRFRELLDQAREGAAHPRVNAVLGGQLDALIVCPSGSDVGLLERSLGKDAEHFGMVHTLDAVDSADRLRDFGLPVVIGPYSMASSRRVLLGATALTNGGIEVAFRGGFPEAPPEALRLTASLAVRHGMAPQVARRALTVGPAMVAGVADRVGAIAPGKDADLVVYSADPLRMDARVLEVYVKGVRVFADD